MSEQELLQPRYKVIADYPYSPYTIGSLMEDTGTRFLLSRTNCYDDFKMDIVEQDNYVSEETILKYPHLFKKLDWWEQRKNSDMPEYIKNRHTGICHKVFEWYRTKNDTSWLIDIKIDYLHLTDIIIATENEYNNQINNKL